MIHDLVPVLRTDLHEGIVNSAFGRWLEKVARCASLFVCVSQNTARDLTGYLQERGLRTPVRVNPLAQEFKDQPHGARQRPNRPARTRRPALRDLRGLGRRPQKWRSPDRRLGAGAGHHQALGRDPGVLRPGWLAEAFSAALARARERNIRIQVIEGCTDDDLAWLYSHALFSAYPSLYEGWGLPVGESLWFDTCCLASNATSIPEVGGDLVRYFSPHDLPAMTEALTWALTQPEAFEVARQVIRQAPLRAWRDHGRDLLEACQDQASEAAPAQEAA